MKNLKSKLYSRPRSDFSNLPSGFNFAKSLATTLLGASLFFGAVNKTEAQECVKYNHDADEFSEEIICWKKDGFDEINLKPNQNKAGLTIIHYSDKDNDNFYENIRIFNYDDKYSDLKVINTTNLEEFYIEKNTGKINYVLKRCGFNKILWNHFYSKKTPAEIVIEDIPEKIKRYCGQQNYMNLTKEQIYSLYPGNWTFYGGFGERVKKLINASKNQIKLENIINNERYLWNIYK